MIDKTIADSFPKTIPHRHYQIQMKTHLDLYVHEVNFPVNNTKRVYEAVADTDGTRLLVERLWPRGVKKTSLKINGWPKDVAPSTELDRIGRKVTTYATLASLDF